MTEEEGEKWGLVPTHAYAVLDIRDYKVSVIKLALACHHKNNENVDTKPKSGTLWEFLVNSVEFN